MNKHKQERRRLTAEFSNAKPNVEGASKACNDTVKELAEKAEEIKALEKMLGVVKNSVKTSNHRTPKISEAPTALKGPRGKPESSPGLSGID